MYKHKNTPQIFNQIHIIYKCFLKSLGTFLYVKSLGFDSKCFLLIFIGISFFFILKWSVSKSPPWVSQITVLTFGISIVEEYAYSVIEKGPAANLPEVSFLLLFFLANRKIK